MQLRSTNKLVRCAKIVIKLLDHQNDNKRLYNPNEADHNRKQLESMIQHRLVQMTLS